MQESSPLSPQPHHGWLVNLYSLRRWVILDSGCTDSRCPMFARCWSLIQHVLWLRRLLLVITQIMDGYGDATLMECSQICLIRSHRLVKQLITSKPLFGAWWSSMTTCSHIKFELRLRPAFKMLALLVSSTQALTPTLAYP